MSWNPENLCRSENPIKYICKEEFVCKSVEESFLNFTPAAASQIPPNQNIVANGQEIHFFLNELIEKHQLSQNAVDPFKLLDQGKHTIQATIPLQKGNYSNKIQVTSSETKVAIDLKIEKGVIVGNIQFHPPITLKDGGPFKIDVNLLELEFRADGRVFAKGRALVIEQQMDATAQLTQALLGQSTPVLTKSFSEIIKILLSKPAETGCLKRAQIISDPSSGCSRKKRNQKPLPLCSSEMPNFPQTQVKVQTRLIEQLDQFFGFPFLAVHHNKESISIKGSDSVYPFQMSFQWDHLIFDNRLMLSSLQLENVSLNSFKGKNELSVPEAKIGTLFFTPNGFPADPTLTTVIQDLSVTDLKLNFKKDSTQGMKLQSADGILHWGQFSVAQNLKLQPGKIPFHFEATTNGFIVELIPIELEVDEMKFPKSEIFGGKIEQGILRIKKENGQMTYEARGVPLALVATIASFKTDGLLENLHCADANVQGFFSSFAHSLELNRCQLSGLFRYSFSSKLQGNIDLQNLTIEKIKIESLPNLTQITLAKTDFDLFIHNASRLRKLMADLHFNGTVALKAEGSSQVWILDTDYLAANLRGKIKFPRGLVSGEAFMGGSPVHFAHDQSSNVLNANPFFILEGRGELSSPICKKVDFSHILLSLNEFFMNGRRNSAWLNGLIQLSGETSFNGCAGGNGEIIFLTADGKQDQSSQFDCHKVGKLELLPDLQIGKAECHVRGIR